MVIILWSVSALLIAQILSKKLYRSSIVILYWFIINTFLSPSVYYSLLNGDSYKRFSQEAYNIYVLIGIILITFLIFINEIYTKVRTIVFVKAWGHGPTIKNLVWHYFITISVFVSGYTFVYRSGFPLLQAFSGNVMPALSRPDVSGDLPHYFVVQTFCTAILPMCYLYFKEKYRLKRIKNVLLFIFVVFFLSVGGNKGLLLYFFVFFWLYVWEFKLDPRIIIAALFSIYIYEFVVNGGIYAGQDFFSVLVSPIRRFFVTQGAMLINRIELVLANYNFSSSNYSKEVFIFVYHVVGGSAPTLFIGDLIIDFGFVGGLMLSIAVLITTVLFAKKLDANPQTRLYELWGFYYLLYLLGNSSIGINFWIRLIIVALSIMIIKIGDKQEVFMNANLYTY